MLWYSVLDEIHIFSFHLLWLLQLESLNQSELASRLTLNCQNSYVEPHKIKDVAVTIIDVSVSLKNNNNTHPEMFRRVTKCLFLPMSRCLTRALCRWRQKKKCTSCFPTRDELTWKREGTFHTCAGVLKSTSTYRLVGNLLMNTFLTFTNHNKAMNNLDRSI